MAISFAAAGTVSALAATPQPVDFPAGIANTDSLLLLFSGAKPSARNISAVDSGFTVIGDNATGGAGSNGTDAGPVRTYVHSRQWDGADAQVSITWSAAASPNIAVVGEFRKTNAGAWSTATANAADSTASDGLTLVATTDPGYTAGDMVVVNVMSPTDGGTWSSPVVTIPGCTVATAALSVNAPTTAGNDGRLGVVTATVTAGTSTGNATLAVTATGGNGNEASGSAIFVRLREPAAAAARARRAVVSNPAHSRSFTR